MPRTARVDAPGLIHHVMVRGIERREIFRERGDYLDLLQRLDRVLPGSGIGCFAWALMPNHVHLVVQREKISISRAMARVNTGYAVAFNRRYGRCGHLFQNRFMSRPVRGGGDLVQLIRYVHLNPLRAGLVRDLAELEAFPWCGYGALVGPVSAQGFHSVDQALELFGEVPADARRRVRDWMRVGLGDGSGCQSQAGEEGAELEREGDTAAAAVMRNWGVNREPAKRNWTSFGELVEWVGNRFGIPPSRLSSASKSSEMARARAVVCCLASRELGMTGHEISRALGIASASAYRAIAQGNRRSCRILAGLNDSA